MGCNVLRLISEPAAALLAYGIGQEDVSLECTALVFRLGGTSMDASIMKTSGGEKFHLYLDPSCLWVVRSAMSRISTFHPH